jgi:hypothetical protein
MWVIYRPDSKYKFFVKGDDYLGTYWSENPNKAFIFNDPILLAGVLARVMHSVPEAEIMKQREAFK